ncbi:hypothetical protein PLUTE_a2090 [Pseudoalteromonas luteoviolacea DSM 6061]|nr:hypothetical protein [Pseudoalteromonas luteoviolacea DSM 6061]
MLLSNKLSFTFVFIREQGGIKKQHFNAAFDNFYTEKGY